MDQMCLFFLKAMNIPSTMSHLKYVFYLVTFVVEIVMVKEMTF